MKNITVKASSWIHDKVEIYTCTKGNYEELVVKKKKPKCTKVPKQTCSSVFKYNEKGEKVIFSKSFHKKNNFSKMITCILKVVYLSLFI